MKLLADTCVSRAAVIELRLAGHDVLYAGELDRDPGDAELLRRAADEWRVVLTLDQDFGTRLFSGSNLIAVSSGWSGSAQESRDLRGSRPLRRMPANSRAAPW